MKSSSLKEKSFIPVKKYATLFILLFIGSILFLLEHFNQEPLSTENLVKRETFNQEKSDVGFLAPNFTLKNLDGNYVGLDNFKNQVVVLNFWATWCAPCRVEMPYFENLYRRYRSRGLTVLAISLDKGNVEGIKSFVDEYALSFPILLDPDGKAERLYPSFTIPFTYVVDKFGRVSARVDGAKNWGSEETYEAIEYLLNQPEDK